MNPLTLPALQVYYALRSSAGALSDYLAAHPAVVPLLSEAVPPLRTAFGPHAQLTLRLADLADQVYLLVLVELPAGAVPDPEAALHGFDAAWWVDNAHRSGGHLVIDYEVQRDQTERQDTA